MPRAGTPAANQLPQLLIVARGEPLDDRGPHLAALAVGAMTARAAALERPCGPDRSAWAGRNAVLAAISAATMGLQSVIA